MPTVVRARRFNRCGTSRVSFTRWPCERPPYHAGPAIPPADGGSDRDRHGRAARPQRRVRRFLRPRRPAVGPGQEAGRRRVHGRAPEPLRGAGPEGRRRARHPQRGWCRHRRRHPFTRRYPTSGRHRGDHRHPPHRLRNAQGHRRGVQGGAPGCPWRGTDVDGGDDGTSRRRSSRRDRVHHSKSLHPAHRTRTRLSSTT
jgi:hypothetical protein